MTPTNKGNYEQCKTCIHKELEVGQKYPCRYSHSKIRKASGEKLERNFKTCGLYNENN